MRPLEGGEGMGSRGEDWMEWDGMGWNEVR